jgi:hypothetical protein
MLFASSCVLPARPTTAWLGQPVGTVVCMHAAVGLGPASASVSQLGVSAQPRDSQAESSPPPNPRAPIPLIPTYPPPTMASFMQPRWDCLKLLLGHQQDAIPTPLYHTCSPPRSCPGWHFWCINIPPPRSSAASSPHPASSSPASWVLPTTNRSLRFLQTLAPNLLVPEDPGPTRSS